MKIIIRTFYCEKLINRGLGYNSACLFGTMIKIQGKCTSPIRHFQEQVYQKHLNEMTNDLLSLITGMGSNLTLEMQQF